MIGGHPATNPMPPPRKKGTLSALEVTLRNYGIHAVYNEVFNAQAKHAGASVRMRLLISFAMGAVTSFPPAAISFPID